LGSFFSEDSHASIDIADQCHNTAHPEITRQLDALDSLQLSKESLHAVRLLQLRRLTRRIETLIPGHFGHGERTAHYARLLGKAISLTDDQHIELHYAALLHDIGLLTLPGRLLDETAAHSLDDYALIQSHPREGAALLSPYRFLSEAARLIAHHHERWDGAGYPYGLRGGYIPWPPEFWPLRTSSTALPIDRLRYTWPYEPYKRRQAHNLIRY
jgi:HD-GYP domain-containing protein (c-di-GMP phosphodiesterase class II)